MHEDAGKDRHGNPHENHISGEADVLKNGKI